jgi:hypothetical protein
MVASILPAVASIVGAAPPPATVAVTSRCKHSLESVNNIALLSLSLHFNSRSRAGPTTTTEKEIVIKKRVSYFILKTVLFPFSMIDVRDD